MFLLGTLWINGYSVWVAPPFFTKTDKKVSDRGILKLPFYELSVSRYDSKSDMYNYIDPVKELLKIDLSDRNPLMKPKDKEKLTEEETVFQTEHFSYFHRVIMEKQNMPLWKLSKQHIEEILEIISKN